MNKRLRSLIIFLGMIFLLNGCSSGPGGETTCSKYLALAKSFDEQIQGSKEQKTMLKKMLADHNKSTDLVNVANAQLQLISFCGVTGSAYSINADKPIQEAFDWN